MTPKTAVKQLAKVRYFGQKDSWNRKSIIKVTHHLTVLSVAMGFCEKPQLSKMSSGGFATARTSSSVGREGARD